VIPFPTGLTIEQGELIERQLRESGILERHEVVEVDFTEGDIDLLGLEVTTMGRAQVDDPAFFSASFAAGIFAAQLLGTGNKR
jgi:hypothetical protein